MVSLKDVNGNSSFQSIVPSSSISKTSSSDSQSLTPLKKGDDLDSSTRAKISMSSHTKGDGRNGKEMKGIAVPPVPPAAGVDHPPPDSSHHQKRRGSNSSNVASPVPDFDSSPGGASGSGGGTRRRRSLKDYANDWKHHKKAIEALSHSDNEEDHHSACSTSTSSKVERVMSVESNVSDRKDTLSDRDDRCGGNSGGGVWTEVSSVSSDSDAEPHSASTRSHRKEAKPQYPQWSRWLAQRFPSEHDDQLLTGDEDGGEEVWTPQGHGWGPTTSASLSSSHGDENEDHQLSSKTSPFPSTTASSHPQDLSRSSSPSNDLLCLSPVEEEEGDDPSSSSCHPDLILSGNSILIPPSEIDDYTKRMLSHSLRSLHRAASQFLHRSEEYINHFLHATHHFSGIPTCIVVYRLERILLYEILKDNTG
jgi:hypothetical protein